ncbi:MAG: hypothetical protein IJA58_08135 [Lachnospiraceae bacterium]|nr:hypothetical protein [Lachnospiraceae bacterium]
MTKKEFKAAMLRGLGRCVKAVRREPEKYRDIVLWACTRDIAYDAQSEGTRSWYVYTMANSYPDKETFICAAAEALKKYRPNRGWDLLHLSELLMFFAWDGYESARQAVEEKYCALLADMYARKRRPNRIFHELSDLEQLGLVLTVDRTSFLRIAGDFGRLYREKRYMQDGDFPWFFESEGGRYRKTMERAAKMDWNIACFLQREQAYIEEREVNWEQRKTMPEERRSGIMLSLWLAKKADRETVEQYALAYREQDQPELRAKALEAFSRCSYPHDPQIIIKDTQSDCEELQKAAWQALENVRHSAVRKFALSNMAKGIHTLENFALLAINYLPEDGELLEMLLRELIAKRDWHGVHSAGMYIYQAYRKDSKVARPKHLLPLLYENTPCSFCRESALMYMSRHRMVTPEILEECLCDSDEDIRSWARKRKRKGLHSTKNMI